MSHSLTPRQEQIIALVATGAKNREIATALNMREGTVKVHLRQIFDRLKVAGRLQVALRYERNQEVRA